MSKIIWLSTVISKLIIFLLLLVKIYESRKIIESIEIFYVIHIKLAILIQNNYIKKTIFKAFLFYSN